MKKIFVVALALCGWFGVQASSAGAGGGGPTITIEIPVVEQVMGGAFVRTDGETHEVVIPAAQLYKHVSPATLDDTDGLAKVEAAGLEAFATHVTQGEIDGPAVAAEVGQAGTGEAGLARAQRARLEKMMSNAPLNATVVYWQGAHGFDRPVRISKDLGRLRFGMPGCPVGTMYWNSSTSSFVFLGYGLSVYPGVAGSYLYDTRYDGLAELEQLTPAEVDALTA